MVSISKYLYTAWLSQESWKKKGKTYVEWLEDTLEQVLIPNPEFEIRFKNIEG